ncbi:MAG: calcium-binding protein [Pseudomonadota bacterium]
MSTEFYRHLHPGRDFEGRINHIIGIDFSGIFSGGSLTADDNDPLVDETQEQESEQTESWWDRMKDWLNGEEEHLYGENEESTLPDTQLYSSLVSELSIDYVHSGDITAARDTDGNGIDDKFEELINNNAAYFEMKRLQGASVQARDHNVLNLDENGSISQAEFDAWDFDGDGDIDSIDWSKFVKENAWSDGVPEAEINTLDEAETLYDFDKGNVAYDSTNVSFSTVVEDDQIDSGGVTGTNTEYKDSGVEVNVSEEDSKMSVDRNTSTNIVTVTSSSDNDFLSIDLVVPVGTSTVVNLNDAADSVSGSDEDDTVYGGDGDDVILGRKGDDILHGGAGNDLLKGGLNHDSLYGDQGDDSLHGFKGNDHLEGNNGNDYLFGGYEKYAKTDVMIGGQGSDLLVSGFRQKIGATEGDHMSGGGGKDVLLGGNANDTLIGGAGNDALTGGAGGDIFEFEAGFGDDVVTDFKGSEGDKLKLVGLVGISGYGDLIDNHRVESNGNTIFTDDAGNSITLEGVVRIQIDDTYVLFG